MNYHRIAARLFNTPLLVMPETALVVADFLFGRMGVDETIAYDGHVAPEASRFRGSPSGPMRADGTTENWWRNEDGVAIISIHGELINRGRWVGASSGLTTYEGVEAQLRAAAADPATHAIVLDVNSPGGEATMALETGMLVRRIAAEKPVVAYVNGHAASACYGIISGAPRIVLPPSGFVGSIGVAYIHMDRSAQLEKSGVRPTLIHAGKFKPDGASFAALPDDARARIQARIDAIYTLFVDTVAQHRDGLDAKAIRATEAGIFMGDGAVAAGLADSVGTLDDVLADLKKQRALSARVFTPGVSTMSQPPNTQTLNTPAPDSITRAEHDAAMTAAAATARTEATAAFTAALAKVFPDNPRASAFSKALMGGLAPDAAAGLADLVPAPAPTAAAPTAQEPRLVPDPKVDAGVPQPKADAGWGGVVDILNAQAGFAKR